MITQHDIDTCTVVNAWHGNMGYVQDEDGNYTDRHKGYCYGYRCVQFSRFTFEDRHYTLDDGGWQRKYMVDGEECAFEDVVRLLNSPPLLSLAELYVWLRMGENVMDWDSMVNWIAGCVQPEPHFIDRATRWGKVHEIFQQLSDKGLVKYKHGKAHRSDGNE